MPKAIVDRPPGRSLRFGLRLPIWLYRLKLSWLLGDRFLMLTHTGRKSGKSRQTIIEVVQHDNQTDTYYVVSGWGEKSDWYQNIRKSPEVTVQAGRRKFIAQAGPVPYDQAEEIMETYAREHPAAFRELNKLFLGKRVEPGKDDAGYLAERMPMIAFHPERTV
ncbi:MAG TPA: nitroreductase family deazaflavin-dependent oxidoreductase [Anaerolineales bacterium]|nr:nitroreductase family deazaflavin-dependent oxidoreductase [Anaerolineales bacterium]